MEVPWRLKIVVPYDSAIPLLGIYPEKNMVWKCPSTSVLIVALLIVAKMWKQPKCPLTEEWIKNMWYIYTIEYYSAINRNAFESVLMRWMNLDRAYYTEWRKSEKGKQILTYMGFLGGSTGKESTCNVGDLGLIPGLGRSPGEGNSYPLQYPGLENLLAHIWNLDRRYWWTDLQDSNGDADLEKRPVDVAGMCGREWNERRS